MWIPKSEEELLTAAQNGTLSEDSTYLELKRELGEDEGANNELASDLASLAVAGGVLIIGVVDEKERGGEPESALHPVDTRGLVERIEQVAATNMEPPLVVEYYVLPGVLPKSEGKGYVVVHIPPSTQAPHMVGGKYYGRSGYTKTRLGDREVEELHIARSRTNRTAEAELEEYMQQDPWILHNVRAATARMFTVATPTQFVSRKIYELPSNTQPKTWLRGLSAQIPNPWGSNGCLRDVLAYPDRVQPCATGWTLKRELGAERMPTYLGSDLSVGEIVITEGFAVKAFNAGLTYPIKERTCLDLEVLVSNVVRLTQIVTASAVASGYSGTWVFGIGLRGLQGVTLANRPNQIDPSYYPPEYDIDEYLESTTATSGELVQDPTAIVLRLIGRLLRAMSADKRDDATRVFARVVGQHGWHKNLLGYNQ